MTAVAVTGAGGALGRRLLPRLAADPGVDRVVAIDRVEVPVFGSGVEVVQGDLLDLPIDEVIRGIDTVVHLAFAGAVELADEVASRRNRDAARRLHRALSDRTGLVLLSSATVYGAWSNNPVPLTEQSPVRPNPGFAYAMHKAEQERVVATRRWRGGPPVAVLRPAVAVAEDEASWLGHQMLLAARFSVGEEDPGWQFLHLDDLAEATRLAAVARLDGPYNVAPDGALSGPGRRALLGGRPRFAVAEAVAEALARPLARGRQIPSGLVPYTAHSWVVANDRIKAEGWEPTYTNEEALVAADEAPPWATMNARQRQYLSLGLMAVGVTGLGVGAVAGYRALRRRLGSDPSGTPFS